MALVTSLFTGLDGVETKAAARNVLTFDGAAGYGDDPGVDNDPAMGSLPRASRLA